MTEDPNYGLFMLVLGSVVLVAVPVRSALKKAALPALVAFIGLGFGLSAADRHLGGVTRELEDQIELLAQLGLVALLFRVGLESDMDRLVEQLRRAVAIWLPNMAIPAALAFALIWAWPGLGPIPALLVGLAASATSIGVSVAPWEEANALESDNGALMLDVAELDDLSAVILLGIVFAIAPGLQQGGGMIGEAVRAGAMQVAKIAVFVAGCYVFSRLVEPRLVAVFARMDPVKGPFVFAAGTVFLIVAVADAIGFSMAIGAIFAGLAFSRDPAELQIEDAFASVLALFGPFFFFSVGLSVGLENFGAALSLAAALFIVLVVGKLLGAGLAAWAIAGRRAGWLIGASMVPRAEIFLIVMAHGLSLGAWAVPPQLYTASVLAAVATCIVGPVVVTRVLQHEARPGGGAT
ncbi:cation:proton antiporter [Paracoccus salsus]|uniref:cation:proton antiporter n=1 Tax=Paracoccus salsus TaxID=2911061 RepID=UPI001F323912|nr:cation:proton antiporter [Paracoccus salsus]MCF3975105.1 cation:proton antiporter [Paracoccus salsus]